MATTTASNGENPKKTLAQSQPSDPNQTANSKDQSQVPSTAAASSNPQQPQPLSSGGGGETKAVSHAGATSAADSTIIDDIASPVTDIQKKIRRAERFGMPVHLSEEEKRNSRAERFGMGAGVHGSDALQKSEDQKRKARAERFGLAQSTAADEEAKKKARLARFAPGSKTDPVEEDKRKARAIRFSQNQSTSLSETNGKGQIETKTAVLGKAGAGP